VRVRTEVKEGVLIPVGGACCLFIIAHKDQDCFTSLSFDDLEFLNKLCAILTGQVGSSISAIGSLDIG
jgi:hypothetical protein